MNEAPSFDEDVPTVLRVREKRGPRRTSRFGGTTTVPVDADTYAVTDQDGADTTYGVLGGRVTTARSLAFGQLRHTGLYGGTTSPTSRRRARTR